jgi:single-strand DNA-binding protein
MKEGSMQGIEAAFCGALGRDPELRTSAAGNDWMRLNVACGNGDATQWVQVSVFGDTAHELSDKLHKGAKVYVEGKLTLNSWKTKEGADRTGLSVAAWRVELLSQIGERRPKQLKPYAPRRRRPVHTETASNQFYSDEIPF